MSEPIQNGCETHKTEEGLGEFVVAGGNAAVGFNPAEEVFDPTALPVVAAVVAGWLEPVSPRWDASPAAVGLKAVTKRLRVEALVRDDATAASEGQQREHSVLAACRTLS